MRNLLIIFLLILPGCGITQALKEMKEDLLEASKKVELPPVGYFNNSYEETVRLRQIIEQIKNRFDIMIAPILEKNPNLKIALMKADFSITPGKPIAKAITAFNFVSPIIEMPGNAVDYTMGGINNFLSENGDLIKGGLAGSIPLALITWGISYFRRKKRVDEEIKRDKEIKDEHNRKLAEKQAEHDRKMEEMDKMYKMSMEVKVEKARLEIPGHLKENKS